MSAIYNLSTVKGSPWRYHIKAAGSWSAMCGKTPGKGRRSGWYNYLGLPSVESADRICEQCLRVQEFPTEAPAERLSRTVLDPKAAWPFPT